MPTANDEAVWKIRVKRNVQAKQKKPGPSSFADPIELSDVEKSANGAVALPKVSLKGGMHINIKCTKRHTNVVLPKPVKNVILPGMK
eukprot:6541311-Prymnesium_polylepis.2